MRPDDASSAGTQPRADAASGTAGESGAGAADAASGSAADAGSPHDPGEMDAGDDAPGVDAGPPARMDCQGKAGAPGDSTRMYQSRAFIVHIPTSVHPNTAVPVLFAMHGAGGRGSDMQVGTGFDVLADQDGFVTVYPDGAGNSPWNVGSGACPPGNLANNPGYDDFAYLEFMLDDVEQDQCINRQQVFVTGMSMGGYFSHHVGCQRGGDLVRAVAPHSGGTYSGDCPGAPLPVLILHGDADPLISFQCAESARDSWLDRNGCAADFDVIDIQGGHCEWYRACPADGQVVLCSFDDLGHNWAFPPMYDHSSLLIWTFFRQYL